MKLKIYQIDAFAENVFEGNPAAVIPLASWLTDEFLQKIAEENNLSETVFFVPLDNDFHIRWFTPNNEVALCGHATLAAAYVLFNCLNYQRPTIKFDSLSGWLSVSRQQSLLTMDFPVAEYSACDTPIELISGLGKVPIACYEGEDYLVVFSNQHEVEEITADYSELIKLPLRGVIATASSQQYDFVSRFFAPKYGIPEDSVTGSAYTVLAPYWFEQLGKPELNARQISPRGGNVRCKLLDNRVLITGSAVKYLDGEINI